MKEHLEVVLNNSLHFFESTYEHFLTSLSQTEEIQKYYRLAGFTVCLRFAGTAFISSLTPALTHLEIQDADECHLTICIWDSFSTQMPPIAFPWPSYFCDVRGEVREYNGDRIYTVVDIHTKVLNVFDKERDLALYWIKDKRDLPWWIGGSPLQLILHWWMREKGYQLTHAAAVGHPQGGVLLTGKSGSGKSTAALSCLKSGMNYVSEDYCFVSDLPDIWAYSVYNSAKIEEKTLRWFPELEKQVENADRAKGDKAFLFHYKFQREKILSGFPLKAILTLKIEQTKNSWLEPIPSHIGVAALSISTMWQLTHTGPIVFLHLKRIVQALPCYALHLGSDLLQAPKLIEKLL